MMIAILFWTFFVASIVLLLWQGGHQERAFMIFLLAAICIAFLLNAVLGLQSAWRWIFLIDAVILAVSLTLAVKSKSHWPLWFAGFQLNAVAAGIAQLIGPTGLLGIYGNTAGFWAFPALGATVVGVMLDRRASLIRSASLDPS